MASVYGAVRRRGLWVAVAAFIAVALASIATELQTGQRATAAKTAALLLYAVFGGMLLFHRRAALMLLMVAMPSEPMLRTWGETRFLTFVYGAVAIMLFEFRGLRRRLFPLDAGFWLLFVLIVWMFASLSWTPTRAEGISYTFGMVGVLVAFVMPRGLFADEATLNDALRALLMGSLIALLLHAALLPETREGRLGAHQAMSPQDVGANLGVALLSALYLARYEGGSRRALLLAAVPLAIGVVLTASRSAVAGTVLGAAALILLGSSGMLRWVRVVLLVVMVGAAYLAVPRYNPRAFEPRIARTVDAESPDQLLTGRLSLWTVALAMIREHPVVGVGVGSFSEEFDRYYRLTPAKHGFGRNPDTHSLPVRAAAELGLPAAMLYIGFLAYALLAAWRARGHPSGVGALALGLTLMCLALTSLNALYQPILWMGTGLGLWVLRQHRWRLDSARPGERASAAPPAGALARGPQGR